MVVNEKLEAELRTFFQAYELFKSFCTFSDFSVAFILESRLDNHIKISLENALYFFIFFKSFCSEKSNKPKIP